MRVGHGRPARPAGAVRHGGVGPDHLASVELDRRRDPRALRGARASARARAWAAGAAPAEVVLDVDSSLVEIHSENKEQAAAHFKGGYGFHPMLCFLDETGEALAGLLRAGNAAANSGADQLAVVDAAIASMPEQWRAGHRPGDEGSDVVHPVLVRADTAGAVASFIAGLVARNISFSVGARVNDQLSDAIATVAPLDWRPALCPSGAVRPGAWVTELAPISGWPEGTRAICRRERPHPGAQLRLWDFDGWRHQVTLTNSVGDAVELELAHRAARGCREPDQGGQRHRARAHALRQLLGQRRVDGAGAGGL